MVIKQEPERQVLPKNRLTPESQGKSGAAFCSPSLPILSSGALRSGELCLALFLFFGFGPPLPAEVKQDPRASDRQISISQWLAIPGEMAAYGDQELTNSSFVNESQDREVLHQMAEAKKMEEGKEWLKAATLYQALIAGPGDTLYRVNQRLYWPLNDFAVWQVSRMSPEGLKIYRDVHDPIAEAILREGMEAGDLARVTQVARDYLCSSHGPDAVHWLANYYFEQGEFSDFLYHLERLGRFLPQEGFANQWMPLKLAIAYKQLCREMDYDRVSRLLRHTLGKQEISLCGQKKTVKNFLKDLDEIQWPGLEEMSWPVFGGSNSHFRRVNRPVQCEGLLWSGEYLQGVNEENVSPAQSTRVSAGFFPVYPAAEGAILFYSIGLNVVARHLATGNLLWKFTQGESESDTSREEGQRGRLLGPPLAGSSLVTVSGGRVYAILREMRAGAFSHLTANATLSCLDAGTGKRLWIRGGDNDTEPLLSRSTFVGAPLVCGNRVYAGTLTDQGGHQSHLVCLDATSGQMLWQTFLSLDRLGGYRSQPMATVANVSAESGGIVSYSTDLGVVAAVRADSGQILWLAKYDRYPQRDGSMNWGVQPEDRGDGHSTSAPVIADGQVFVMPTDSDYLFCLDARTGALRWKKHREENVYLLGVDRGRLYLSGNRVYCLDTGDGALLFRSVELEGTPAGQGLVGRDFVYCPGRTHLYQILVENGKLGHAWPWGEGREPGHLLQAGGFLMVAGESRLEVYAGEDYYQQHLEFVRLNPQDVSGRLELSYLCLSRNEVSAAIEHLKIVLELAPPGQEIKGRPIHQEARMLLFQAYTRQAEEAKEAGNAAGADEAFERALEVAGDPKTQFLATVNLALHREERQQWEGAVRLYQQLIERFEGFRKEEGDLNVAAEVFGQERIQVILGRAGRDPYGEFERKARELLRQAGNQDWYVRCRDVWGRYPNSLAALEALIVLGTTTLQNGAVVEAFQYWSALSRLDPEKMGLIAEAHKTLCFASLGETEKALRILEDLEKRFANRRLRLFDKEVEFAEFRSQILAKSKPEEGHPAPRFSAPVEQAWTRQTDNLGLFSLIEAYRDHWRSVQPVPPLLAGRRLIFTGPGGAECWDVAGGKQEWLYSRRKSQDGWLGIQISQDESHLLRRVQRVIDRPAREAGLLAGDILLQIGNAPIAPAEPPPGDEDDGSFGFRPLLNEVVKVIKGSPQHQEIPIVVKRGTQRVTLKAKLDARPEMAILAGLCGEVAVVAAPGELVGIDVKTGQRLWVRLIPELAAYFGDENQVMFIQTGQEARAPVTSSQNSVALGLLALNFGNNRLRILDAAKGNFVWETAADGVLLGSSMLTEELVISFVRRPSRSGNSGKVQMIVRDLWDGRQRYRLDCGSMEERAETAFALGGRDSFFVLSENELQCRKLRTGTLLWSQRLKGQRPTRLLCHTNRIMTILNKNTLAVHDLSSGSLLWKRRSPEGTEWAYLAAHDSQALSYSPLLVGQLSTGQIEAMEVSTGRVVWRYEPANPIGEERHDPLGENGVLVVLENGTQKNMAEPVKFITNVVLLEMKTGTRIQKVEVPGEVRFARISDGLLVVLTTEGAFVFRPLGGQSNFQ